MAEMYAVSGETLSTLANAIRTAAGTDDFMTVASMAAKLEGLPVRKETFLHGEDWTDTSTGNTLNFFETYMGAGVTPCVRLAVIHNTYSGSATAYYARFAIKIKGNGTDYSGFWRGVLATSSNSNITASYGFYVGAGSTIDIYTINLEE